MCENMSRSSNQEIDTRFSRDCKNTNLEEANHGRLRDPVVCRQPVGSFSTFNEVDIENIWIATRSCETSRPFSCS